MSPELFAVVAFGVLGALIGSFGNVVVYRLPAGRSVVRPRSSCPHCGHELGPLELIPIVSWLALRARCGSCGEGISARYPLVEAWMAAGFAVIAWRWQPFDDGLTPLLLAALFAILTVASLIDADTTTLPDGLTLPGTALALAAAFLWAPGSGLPGPGAALFGALVGAGALALVNRVGSLVLRRGRDTRERLWPLGFDQLNVAAAVGAVGGAWVGVGAGLLSLLANLALRRPLRLPEGVVYGIWLLALLLAAGGVGAVGAGAALGGSVAAAGAWALLGALWWWIAEIAGLDGAESDAAESDAAEPDPAADEPVAMGFGDAKLAALLGALLGWQGVLVGIFAAVVLGALGGIAGRLAGGGRVVPFGPYLALGGLVALFWGDALIAWYLGMLFG